MKFRSIQADEYKKDLGQTNLLFCGAEYGFLMMERDQNHLFLPSKKFFLEKATGLTVSALVQVQGQLDRKLYHILNEVD